MTGHFQIKPTKDEIEMLIMLTKQESWKQGMEKFMLRYEAEAEKKLNNLTNDHDTDLMCKVIKKTIQYIREIPYRLKEEMDKKEVQET